ncbi:MAG: 30S ribosomal protein S8 [Rickettsiales bacterium]|jgi:small subunit ribosomal protein S8|nr:30S ribosomal protein S8 [Rickettsiales bacterium]
MTNHAVSELVCLLKNGQLARKYKVSTNFSKIKQSILNILKREGYIKDFNVVDGKSFNLLEVKLSYYDGVPVIRNIEVVSKPGQRKYIGVKDIPIINNGLGMVILSTPNGVLSDLEAKVANVGGELLLKIF